MKKRMKKRISGIMLLIASAVFALSGCGSSGGGGGSKSGAPAVNPSAYPKAADGYEGAGGDDTAATAGSIVVGKTQVRTIYPTGDQDWVKVTLSAGVEYEMSVNNLNVNGDAEIDLYGTDGTTLLENNDDYIDLDSQVTYTPTVTGEYYVKASHLYPTGVLAYTLGVREFTDGDSDGYSPYYDCNDSNVTIYPRATEVVADGIDQDCNGVDWPTATDADAAEVDNTYGAAKTMMADTGSAWEEHLRDAENRANLRTIHKAGNIDWFKITVPAYGAFEADHRGNDGTIHIQAYVYESDAATVVDSGAGGGLGFENYSSYARTYYVSYEAANGIDTFAYLPVVSYYGTDEDGDGYYTQEGFGSWDCNDTDDTIHEGARETADDGIDSDCNGEDNTLIL